MKTYQIVLDTNVIVSALRSKRGASYRLLSLLDSGGFEVNISVPLVCEYEQVTRQLVWPGKPRRHHIEDILDYICKVGNKWKIYFLWRPRLSDPKDDMVLEVAVASKSDYIVTFNRADFLDAKEFGIGVLDPYEFLRKLGEYQ